MSDFFPIILPELNIVGVLIRLNFHFDADSRTDIFLNTLRTFRFPRLTDFSPVPDEPVRKHYPIFFQDEFVQLFFDFFRRGFFGQTQSLRQARKMSLGDSLIAATALVFGRQLLTRNVQDFASVPGLVVVDPLAAGDPA